MNDLEKYFYNNRGNLIHKWKHYFEIYDRHFRHYRGTDVVMVEFGVFQGGSLEMWRDYFGPRARIIGVDINPECRVFADNQIEIMIGDQEDRGFLRSIAAAVPRIDILLDDGGHTMKQQIATFEELFPHIDKNGVYLCEDLLTSYRPNFGGGYKDPNSFIEYSKNFIDYIHAWHSHDKSRLDVNPFTRSARALHYYDSILVIEKREMSAPSHMKTGTPRIGNKAA
jgi:hypothetical protein